MRRKLSLLWPAGMFTIIATMLAAVAVGADEKLPDYYVVAIGVSEYAHIRSLTAPASDARRIVEYFRSLGADGPDAVVNSDATAKRILTELQTLEARVKPHQTVVIYLNGHGSRWVDDWQFLPHDYDPSNPRTALSGRAIITAGSVLESTNRVMLILDACQAGHVQSEWDSGLSTLLKRGSILLASSIGSQPSLDGKTASLFTAALLDCLSGTEDLDRADLDRDGLITLKELQHNLPIRIRKSQKDWFKLPGLVRTEQDCVCRHSFGISETLSLFPAPKTAVSFEAVNGFQRALEAGYPPGFADSAETPVGLWAWVNVGFDPDGTESWREVYVIRLDTDSHYYAEFEDSLENRRATVGKWFYERGRRFYLEYENGRDILQLVTLTKDKMVVSSWNSGPKVEFSFIRMPLEAP